MPDTIVASSERTLLDKNHLVWLNMRASFDPRVSGQAAPNPVRDGSKGAFFIEVAGMPCVKRKIYGCPICQTESAYPEYICSCCGNTLYNYSVFENISIDEYYKRKHTKHGYVYLVQCGPYYKIGMTSNVVSRLSALQAMNPYPISLIYQIKTCCPSKIEKEIHDKLSHCRLKGEWFSCGRTEALDAIDDIISRHKIKILKDID